jgi:hypothetical protein
MIEPLSESILQDPSFSKIEDTVRRQIYHLDNISPREISFAQDVANFVTGRFSKSDLDKSRQSLTEDFEAVGHNGIAISHLEKKVAAMFDRALPLPKQVTTDPSFAATERSIRSQMAKEGEALGQRYMDYRTGIIDAERYLSERDDYIHKLDRNRPERTPPVGAQEAATIEESISRMIEAKLSRRAVAGRVG